MTKPRQQRTKVRAEGYIQYGVRFVLRCYRKSLPAETLVLTQVEWIVRHYIIMALSQFSDKKQMNKT